MSTLHQFRQGFSRAWESLTEGWRELRDRAGDALTRFKPKTSRGEVETREDRVVSRASRWGLLAAEVTDDDDTVQVTVEVPGLEAGDFDVETRDDILIVRGEKKVTREESRGHYYVMERAYGQFERAIRLPAAVEDSGARASYQAGVLSITLPKSKTARTRRITVQT